MPVELKSLKELKKVAAELAGEEEIDRVVGDIQNVDEAGKSLTSLEE